MPLNAAVVGAAVAALALFVAAAGAVAGNARKRGSRKSARRSEIADGLVGLVGNTPLVRLQALSRATGCEILAKAEFLNPGGSSKDRVAKHIILHAEEQDLIIQGDPRTTIYEGTVGSTGISLAMIARARGYKCCIFMPDDQAIEKVRMLEALGAIVRRVRPVSIIDSSHYRNLARDTAKNDPHGFFADQFENTVNWKAHYETTGPEIWDQTEGNVDAIVMGAGTGGTLAGVAAYLKEQNPQVKVFLADPTGSGLFHKVKHGVMYAPTEAEGKRSRHQVDSIVEGVGINRQTANFAVAEPFIDDAFRVDDQNVVDMAHYLMHNEGLFIGSSSALNCVGAVRAASLLGPGHTIVTILPDAGHRHLSRFWNPEVLSKMGITSTYDGGASLKFLERVNPVSATSSPPTS